VSAGRSVPSGGALAHGGLVVDASVAAAWCFEDEASPFTDGVLDEVVHRGAEVPALWLFEMSNVLSVGATRPR
jgi:hypothetical protein